MLNNQSAAIGTVMDLFESDISENDPPRAVAAAREYIAAQRRSMQQRSEHTYTGAGAPVTTARVKLDYACGVK